MCLTTVQSVQERLKVDKDNEILVIAAVFSMTAQCLELQLKDSFLNEHEDSRDTHIK